MLKPKAALIAFLALFQALTLSSQIRQLSLSGTYAPIINTINITEINYTASGLSLEYEYKSRKHFSFGIEVDWQKYTVEKVYLTPYQISDPLLIQFNIRRNQFNLRPVFRYYWKENFDGFYIGVAAVYSILMARPEESPKVKGYSTHYTEIAYKSAAGTGLTYGYRFKLTPVLRLSAFGTHQVVFSDIYDDNGAHQDHLFGLGLNWTF